MQRRSIPATISLLLFSHLVFAVELAPVVVTATRTAETVDETLASVTVVTREDIERRQAQSVPDILRSVPGVGIVNSGGPGKTTSVFLRGTNSGHVLVLIDGIKVGSATMGRTAFQHIPIAQIERIEVARGPRSSLYGSEAVGGVIQIFTRKGGGELRPFLRLGYGSRETYSASAGVSGGGERGWFNLSVSGNDTEGFDTKDDAEFDKDGYRELSGSLRAGYRFDNDLEVDLHLLHAVGDAEFDGSTNQSESLQQVVGGTLRYAPRNDWQLTLTGGQSRDESDNFKDGAFESRYDTRRNIASLQSDLVIGQDLVTLGFDYQDDAIDTSQRYAVTSRDNKGLFAEYQGTFSAHDVQLSLRRDDNAQFGKQATGGAAWGYLLGEDLRLTASYGAAFKAPTLNDLYYPYDARLYGGETTISEGNPELSPEESRTTELGARYTPNPATRMSLSAYETRIRNLIDWVSASTGANETTWSPANTDRARIRGLEAILATRVKDWDLGATLTLLDPKNRSSDANNGNLLPRRPRRSLRFQVDRRFGKYAVGGTLFAESMRYDRVQNTLPLAGYATLDLRAEYAFAKDWRIQARIENLLDKDYRTSASYGKPYNQPGRGLFLTVRYEP
uniref:Vitamin B12 transporter n=1 Tax=Candidatus Kentrum sp. LPFa TaxID=2126335 RepID=A0A450WQU0_9GAMM|nr:MAG: vitamin B12 transporter [Candidatus Kentron sp. LPFa]